VKEGKKEISTAYFFDHFAENGDVEVVVEEGDFVAAERELVPSVSEGELVHYKRVRAQFEKVEEGKEGEGKGKGKEKVAIDRKGKGKAVESLDSTENGADNKRDVKGKGKAVDMGFADGEGDDDGLY
jgi:peroxin-6